MGHHQRRALQLLEHLGHDEGLAGCSCTQQRLVLIALFNALNELRNRARLIAGGLIGSDNTKGHAAPSIPSQGISVEATLYPVWGNSASDFRGSLRTGVHIP